jgi:hypothetical protein
MYFLEDETTIFKGRSPSGRDFPAGDNHQPLGSNTRLFSFGSLVGCATDAPQMMNVAKKNMIDFFMSKN